MRGSSAVTIVAIIVVIAGIGFFALQYLPGGIPSVNINYKNDVIAIEDVFLSNSKPYEGTDTTLQFNVVNNGDKKVKNVILTFESTGGGFDAIKNPSDLKCADVDPQAITYTVDGKEVPEYKKCVFNEIDSLGLKHISLTLHAVETLTDSPYNIKYSVQYDYIGQRIATIPIIDSSTRSRPISRFSQSTSSIGPLVLEFQAGEAREFTEGGKKVTGYWLEYGTSAEVKMNLKNIGIGSNDDIRVNEKTFTLDTKGTLSSSGVCNFVVDAQKNDGLLYYCRNLNPSGSGCDLGQPMRPVKLPAQLSCNFNPSQKLSAPEVSATILASFDYTYKFTKTQQVTVRNFESN